MSTMNDTILTTEQIDLLTELKGQFTWAITDADGHMMEHGDMNIMTLKWMGLQEQTPGKWKLEAITYAVADPKTKDAMERFAIEMAYAGQDGERPLKEHRERIARFEALRRAGEEVRS